MLGLIILLVVLGSMALLAILWEPSASQLLAGVIERRAAWSVALLRAHAAGRVAARAAYWRVFRNARVRHQRAALTAAVLRSPGDPVVDVAAAQRLGII